MSLNSKPPNLPQWIVAEASKHSLSGSSWFPWSERSKPYTF